MLTRVRKRLRIDEEEGFGLIELLISIIVLSIGVAALIAIFMASAFSVARAGRQGTATVLMDRVFEYYKRAPWQDIRLVKSGPGALWGVDDADTAADAQYSSQCSSCPTGASSVNVDEDAGTNDEYGTGAINNTATCNTGLDVSAGNNPNKDPTAPLTNCLAIATVTGADNKPYRVYTYMKYACQPGTSGGSCVVDYQTKLVTIIVRLLSADNSTLASKGSAGILAKQTQAFAYNSYTTIP